MNARAIVQNLFLLTATVLGTGCLDSDALCDDDACEDEEVAEANQAIKGTIDLYGACAKKGWWWDPPSQTCVHPKTVCENGGNVWITKTGDCVTPNSQAHKEAICANAGLKASASGNTTAQLNGYSATCFGIPVSPTTKSDCESQGKYWYVEASKCLAWGSTEHKSALCARNGLVYKPQGTPNFHTEGISIRCELAPSSAPPINTNEPYVEGFGCQVGLNCPTDPNPNTWDPYQNSWGWQPMKNCFDPEHCY